MKTPEPAPAPEPPKPPPPKVFAAQVELAPIKGDKLKPVTVKFEQTEGQSTKVAEVELLGLKPGKYQLVVHESGDCGNNGAKAGKPIASEPIKVEIAKGATGKVEGTTVAIALEGDGAIVGKTLVLHDEDKAGKPGKVHACGVVSKIDMPSEPAAAAEPTGTTGTPSGGSR